jgi:hypothetical protein
MTSWTRARLPKKYMARIRRKLAIISNITKVFFVKVIPLEKNKDQSQKDNILITLEQLEDNLKSFVILQK